jgi:peptidoglycan/xylan/chitin deacetylase (PgdA/CDA1 family)
LSDTRTVAFRTALDTLHLFGAHHMLRPFSAGCGFAFMLHHVRPDQGNSFAPNHLLEVTPDFLDAAIVHARAAGYEFVDLDEAWARLTAGTPAPRFCTLTFDDGYRDFADHAMPVLRRHRVPATVFVASAFADGTGDLWWEVLEEVLRRASSLEIDFGEGTRTINTATTAAKAQAWTQLMSQLHAMPEADMRAAISWLAAEHGVDGAGLTRRECMDWNMLRALASDPLVTIGAHTVNHYMLAKWPAEVASYEMERSRTDIFAKVGTRPRHLAFPVGGPAEAGAREFDIARQLGFTTAWTTRPGHLFAAHGEHATALPRVSLNGNYQAARYLDLFVSGAPFALWNGFRRVNAA